ncbi:MAG TPA: hypothetical protein VKP30_02560 [Polyangiaceae bacterium]|nr:hypothetical protein [Polyangiaceae bacterium]
MTSRTLKRIALVLGLMLVPAAATVGCGGGKPKTPVLTAGEMPEGATWKGVYYSPIYGNLHLVEDGGEIKGAWRTVAGDSWGELTGKADGNLLRYEWVEHRIGMVGPSADRTGHGYFKYSRKATEGIKEPDQIQGEWGLAESETGNVWKATRQTNMEPEPKSVKPDEVESAGSVQAGGWDSGSGKGSDDKDKDKDKDED